MRCDAPQHVFHGPGISTAPGSLAPGRARLSYPRLRTVRSRICTRGTNIRRWLNGRAHPPWRRLGGQSFEDERGIEFAARQQVGYVCPQGHEFEITMSVEAE